jgi:hypothetical protein
MTSGSHRALALTARVCYLESLAKGSAAMVKACREGARLLASQSCEPALRQRRQNLALDLPPVVAAWQTDIDRRIHEALRDVRLGRSLSARPADSGALSVDIPLTLVEDQDVERDLVASRLAQAVSDMGGQEFTDLNARLQAVGGPVNAEAGPADVLSGSWVARWVVEGWLSTDLNLDHWATLQNVLHSEVAQWAQEAYHHANRILLDHGVRPEIDLRPFIRRAREGGTASRPAPLDALGPAGAGNAAGGAGGGGTAGLGGSAGFSMGPGGASAPGAAGGAGAPGTSGAARPVGRFAPSGASGNSGLQPMGQTYDETRMLTQTPVMRAAAQSQAVLGRLNEAMARQVPGFATGATTLQAPVQLSPGLGEAIQQVDQVVRRHADPSLGLPTGSPAALLQDLQEGKQALKKAAASPAERATIEIVALLFQSILQEERLPASIRVWFARLQMPVLRVAVTEPDFFATISHPARMLIDRMGACVMGFVGVTPKEQDDALHREIKRVVQVVEAYPETGRRVFQTVLAEFERFLETYFRDQNEASKKGVSLAQQVEQRETWAIQYTIELRKMLDGVPVHEGVREFMFKVWADVLAHSAVQTGQAGEETKAFKRAAADLIWSASAKTSREERADVLMRLPPLLKLVRQGMARAGLPAQKQDSHIHALNAALAAAFSARSSAISTAHLQEVMERLDSLGDLLPEIGEVELDAQTLRDLSGHESDDLEVVAEGGTMPTPAMLGWARELQVGTWFTLDYRGSQEPVQLAWQGMGKQLALFVSPRGRGILFQLHRLAAFLQAGLIVPAEDESLTTRATRQALAKIDADPARLLG